MDAVANERVARGANVSPGLLESDAESKSACATTL
jgi:hypothetical protein